MSNSEAEGRVSVHLAPRDGMPLPLALESALHHVPFPLVQSSDAFLFVRGYPVAPWIAFKPAESIWRVWILRLQELFAIWECGKSPCYGGANWLEWYGRHTRMINAQSARDGLAKLLACIEELNTLGYTGIHIVGHSVGAYAAIQLLDHARRQTSEPLPPLRSAIALDTSLTSIDFVRSAWATARRRTPHAAFNGLGAWAASQSIGFLQVTNESDWWTYGKLADGPYLPVAYQGAISVRDQLDGTAHDEIRRWAALAAALWQ